MATYLKRSSRMTSQVTALKNAGLYATGTLREFICPICRCILVEPVTLPCNHSLCLGCTHDTFQHNSLTCPLCRLRVGSFVRQASKAGVLVNAQLWDLIRKRFPKEVEQRSSDVVDDDMGFEPSKRIISAKGEIKQEYELELRKLREEQEQERLASEELIRKIQDEENRKNHEQMRQDQLLAKSLAKGLNNGGSVVHNAVTKIVTHQPTITNHFNSKASNDLRFEFPQKNNRQVHGQDQVAGASSMSKIYGLQSKEELQVPSDILSNKKKKLGVEVCLTTSMGQQGSEERIGSAHSAGSHDSINQEIHHFKPIKIMPRTALKVVDGRSIDPKLIRTAPTVKKASCLVVRPPNQLTYMRMFGSSWSAFKRIPRKECPQQQQTSTSILMQPADSIRDLKKSKKKAPQLSITAVCLPPIVEVHKSQDDSLSEDENFDRNKNYTKPTKTDEVKNVKRKEELPMVIKNGLVFKMQSERETEEDVNVVDCDSEQPRELSPPRIREKKVGRPPVVKKTSVFKTNISPVVKKTSIFKTTDSPLAKKTSIFETAVSPPLFKGVVENIAERIKRRKQTDEGKSSSANSDSNNRKDNLKKRKKHKEPTPTDSESSDSDSEEVWDMPKKVRKTVAKSSTSLDENDDEDKDVIEEQKLIEQQLRQEKEDRELALKLQAEFNAIAQVSGRTRGSRKITDYMSSSQSSRSSSQRRKPK